MFMNLKSLWGGKRRAGGRGGVFADDASLSDKILPIYIGGLYVLFFGGFCVLVALKLMGRL